MLVFDDRTGIVGELRGPNHLIIPRQMLMTGSGDEAQKGFKCEWATLYGDELIVGSQGKARREEWIRRLGPEGYTVTSENWSDAYRRMRTACGRRGRLRCPRGGGVASLSRAMVLLPAQGLDRVLPRSDRRAREGQQPADRGRRVLRAHRGPVRSGHGLPSAGPPRSSWCRATRTSSST
jgi:Apyrase